MNHRQFDEINWEMFKKWSYSCHYDKRLSDHAVKGGRSHGNRQELQVQKKAPVLFLNNWIIQHLCFRGFVFLTRVKSLISASLCSAHVGKQISQCCFPSALCVWEESKSLWPIPPTALQLALGITITSLTGWIQGTQNCHKHEKFQLQEENKSCLVLS